MFTSHIGNLKEVTRRIQLGRTKSLTTEKNVFISKSSCLVKMKDLRQNSSHFNMQMNSESAGLVWVGPKTLHFCFLFCLVLTILGFELRALCLLGKCHLSHTSRPFCVGYF
jgi:hypothetical protein